jgi:hypothetical protein
MYGFIERLWIFDLGLERVMFMLLVGCSMASKEMCRYMCMASAIRLRMCDEHMTLETIETTSPIFPSKRKMFVCFDKGGHWQCTSSHP